MENICQVGRELQDPSLGSGALERASHSWTLSLPLDLLGRTYFRASALVVRVHTRLKSQAPGPYKLFGLSPGLPQPIPLHLRDP